jgi:hypothetical protein
MDRKQKVAVSCATGVVVLALAKNFTDKQAAALGISPIVIALAVAGLSYVVRSTT